MPRASTGDRGIDFTFNTPWESGKQFFAETKGAYSIVFFLRYYGCTACQFEIHSLLQNYAQFRDAGAKVFVVLQSEAETIQGDVQQHDIPFTIIIDPRQQLYAMYAIGSRDPNAERTPEHVAKMAEAKAQGFAHGKYEGNEYQLPAVFVYGPDHSILFAHYGVESSDIPAYDVLVKVITEQA
jgi:Peroxiredoxin